MTVLDEARVDSLAESFHRKNFRAWREADSLYARGVFGPEGSSEARKGARIHLQLRSLNGFDYIWELSRWHDRAFLSDEAAMLRPLGRDHTRATVFPLRFLHRGLITASGFCAEYDLPETFDEMTWIGGGRVGIRSERGDPAAGGLPRLRVAWPTRIHQSVELVLERRLCGRMQREILVDRGDTVEVLSIFDLEGWFVRKAGLHRCTALIFWRSLVRGQRDPVNPRLGACAYFPDIHLDLPFFLPDLGLDDLRDYDLPLPILDAKWVRTHRSNPPGWLESLRSGVLSPWDAEGPRPEVIEERYPDL